MSRNAFFSSRSKNSSFLWRWCCGKKTIRNVVYRGLYSHRQRVRVITLFPNIFSYRFCMLSEFAKAFERKVWRVQVANLHNAARALSSPSRCFQLSTNLDKDFCRYLWYCGKKKQIECRLALHWWNSTDLGFIDMFFTNQNAEIVAFMLSLRKSRHKPNLESTSTYGFSPDLERKNGGVLSMRMQVILDSLFARPGSAPLWGRKKGEFSDWTSCNGIEP